MKTRKTQPKNNKYFIRQVSGGYNGAVKGSPTISGADVLCNCVGYANGRFNEIGEYGKCKFQLVCNAENFIESAKKQGLKISNKPVTGGIMVWQKGATLGGGDGAGHVAVVEEVYADGSILTSESGWASWAFKTVRRDNSNGRWGQSSAYKFRGCIINPAVSGEVVPTPKLDVDGIGGAATIRALQGFLGTPEDGLLSGQNKALKKYYPAITAVAYGSNGSTCVKALQKWVGTSADGVWGEQTSKALQKKLGVTADGIFGVNSVKALQTFLNSQMDKKEESKKEEKKEDPAPAKTDYLVIDVSEFQKTIDWAKVKAAGVKGAIIRCAGRGGEKGNIYDDAYFVTNIKGAHKAGLKVGIYFLTQAINAAEGKEEAQYAINVWKKTGISLSYPICIDSEDVSWEEKGKTVYGRAHSKKLSKAKRTEAIKAFAEECKRQGYDSMIYASTSWLYNQVDMSVLSPLMSVWAAQWASSCDYKGKYILWQYSSSGSVSGIKGNVDMDRCYIEGTETKVPETPVATTVAAVAETTAKKTVDELAKEVIDGKWGSGDERKKRLTDAGYDYDAVQKKVNALLAPTGEQKVEEKKPYSGTYPSTKLVKTSQQVINDALTFSKWIVNDNRFGYGRQGGSKYKGTKVYSVTHSGGCHFCGSNAHKIAEAKKAGLKNPEQWEYTYVCNTFVHACYAHAGVPSMLSAKGHAWWISSYQKSKYWTEIKKPSKITDLKPGDVLAWGSNGGSTGHFCMYIGNGKGREATSGGLGATFTQAQWNKTIRETDFSRHFKNATHVFRFTGTVNTTASIRYGEVSYRVTDLQKFLKWYGIELTCDGIFGDATLKAVKQLQKDLGVTVDGIVGPNTLTVMGKVVK